MAFNYLRRKHPEDAEPEARWIAPRLGPQPQGAWSEVFDTGRKTIVDCAHVRVERLDTDPVLFSKVFRQFEDRSGHTHDYRYWAERENYFLREFLKRQNEFSHVVQARHLISEEDAAKQVLTRDAGITIAHWLRVKARYADTATLSHPFQRSDVFLHLIRACLVALKEIHGHRIVHCDIKEDNICIPYAPYPYPGAGATIRLEFDKLKLIDFAFSVAHAIPLTQVLVINPEERVAYQSELLIAALRADRRSGSPNAVQQLDYRVDLYSLGYMAEKISAAGLDSPSGAGNAVLEDIRTLVQKLKACDSAPGGSPLPPGSPLPHDDLIAEIDRLLEATAGRSASPAFTVDGEWSAQELGLDRRTVRKTPLTPVALPLPTPVALALAPAPPAARGSSRSRSALLVCLALAFGGVVLYEAWPSTPAAVAVAPVAAPSVPQATADALAAEDAEALASAGPQAKRAQAFGRLIGRAQSGDPAAAQRVAGFEKEYDAVKQTVAKSAWWVRGEGAQPGEAARWIENGALLAHYGDRPALLDQAFALGHGRILEQDRVRSVETYLQVISRSQAGDDNSKRIRLSALRGLAAMLDTIVTQKDRDAAGRLLPALEAATASGASDLQAVAHRFRTLQDVSLPVRR